MPPLRPIPKVESWTDAIVEAVRDELTAVITVREPGTPGKYDPKTDARADGVDGAIVIRRRSARLQARKATSETGVAGEWSKKRRYIAQFEPESGDPLLRKGQILVVDESPDSPALAGVVFQVEGPRISSRAALTTVDIVTEFGGAE